MHCVMWRCLRPGADLALVVLRRYTSTRTPRASTSAPDIVFERRVDRRNRFAVSLLVDRVFGDRPFLFSKRAGSILTIGARGVLGFLGNLQFPATPQYEHATFPRAK